MPAPRSPLCRSQSTESTAIDRGYEREARRFLAEVDTQVEKLALMPPVEFFRAAPIDVARTVLGRCIEDVDARRHERPAAVVVRRPTTAWQPRLLAGIR